MKKKLVLLGLFPYLLLSCSKKEDTLSVYDEKEVNVDSLRYVTVAKMKTDLERENIKGRVKMIKKTEWENLDGLLLKEEDKEEVVKYNKDGNYYEIHKVGDFFEINRLFNYEKNKKVEEVFVNREFSNEYVYQILDTEIEVYKAGILIGKEKYNDKGNLIERLVIENDKTKKYEYTYNEKGKLKEEKAYNEYGDLDNIKSFRYNHKGELYFEKYRKMEKNFYEDSFDKDYEIDYVDYEYDSKGNWVKRTKKDNRKTNVIVEKREIEYY